MKKRLLTVLAAFVAMTVFTGCLDLQLGGGTRSKAAYPTVGEQLIDLQKARDAGAITQAEYERQKAKLLGER